MKVRNILAAAGLVTLAPMTLANDFSYTHVDASYSMLETEVGNFDVDADGLGLGISVAISDMVYIVGGYSTLEYDDSDVEQDALTAGIGAHTPVTENTDLYGEVVYLNAEIESRFISDDDSGYGLAVGLRHSLNSMFELEGRINYVDIFDDSNTGITVGGRAYLAPAVSIGLAYTSADDTDGLIANFRFDF